MYNNIVMSGGTARFENIASRLENDLYKKVDSTTTVKVANTQEASYHSWIGASILGTLT